MPLSIVRDWRAVMKIPISQESGGFLVAVSVKSCLNNGLWAIIRLFDVMEVRKNLNSDSETIGYGIL